MDKETDRVLRPDSKNRVCLGSLAKGVSGYKVTIDDKTKKITLEPYVEIPLKEIWLYENDEAFARVKKGLEDSAAKDTIDRGSFSEYRQDEL